jgi:uncharacterized phage-associated protein
MKEYEAKDIARYVVFYCHKYRYPISNLKLQKILYFIQAYFLVKANKPCFSDVIEAWDYCPIVPSVFEEYKIFGSLNIPCTDDGSEFRYIKDDDYDLLNRILSEVSKNTESQLTYITRNQLPWINARKSVTNRITNKAIADYFKE